MKRIIKPVLRALRENESGTQSSEGPPPAIMTPLWAAASFPQPGKPAPPPSDTSLGSELCILLTVSEHYQYCLRICTILRGRKKEVKK